MGVHVVFSDTIERTADDRGRITLGSDYAGETVTLVVLEEDDE
jgi:hypothetical protein